jgi:hypothetical protein
MASSSEKQQARGEVIVRIGHELKELMSSWSSRLRSNSSNCCIYRVPEIFWQIKGKEYKPRIVSIEPYHKNDEELRSNKGYKLQFLNSMLSRTGLTLERCFESIMPLEKEARDCYSGYVYSSASFLETMVVDSCFIIELFRKYNNPMSLKPDDPVSAVTMILPYLYGDLLLLECQIPFFVLQNLFDISKMLDEKESLSLLALQFFNNVFKRPNEVIEEYANHANLNPPLHLLDLVRSSFIPNDSNPPPPPQKDDGTPTQFIRCISRLRRVGIKVSPGKAETFLAVKFKRGVIELPPITTSGFIKLLLRNCLAFEQLHKNSSKHFTVYATFLDCLVNTSEDVQYLRQRQVFDNYLATDAQVADFINKLGKEVSFEIPYFYLSKLFNDVNRYYENRCHVHCASFMRTYFQTPWSIISASAAIVLLLLTLAQTIFTII